MKQSYLNAVYSKLVLEKDYAPIQAETGEFLTRPELKVLARAIRMHHQVTEIIDGDAFNPEFLKGRLEFSYNLSNEAGAGEKASPKVSRQVYIIVFEKELSPEYLQVFQTYSSQSMMPERFVITVNLAEGQVGVFGWKPGVYGEVGLLKKLFKEDLEPYRELPDYGELLTQKRREYTIEIQTSRTTVTYILIGINIAAWLLISLISWYYHVSYNNLLQLFGAKDNLKIIQGEYWRLLAPMFLHAGELHLFVNCYSLYVLGNVMEKIYGHWKFTVIYFAAGIIGNIASFVFSSDPAVGASGAIFGLFGALLYFGVEQPKQFQKYFKSSVLLTIALNGFLWIAVSGLDNYAHLGGLGGGFLSAGACGVKMGNEAWPRKRAMLMAAIILAVAGLYIGFKKWQ